MYRVTPYLLLILVIVTSGCATKPVLERENIRYLRVNDVVEINDRSLYDKSPYGSSGGGGGSGNAAATAIVIVFGLLDEMTRDRDKLKKHIEGKNIYIDSIIKNELINQLSNNDAIVLVNNNEKYDALLTVTITRYGVDKRRKMLVFREYKPYIKIVVKLTDPDQRRTIWQQESVVSAETDEVKGYSKKLYFSEETYMQDSFKQAAGIVVGDALRPLFKK